MSNLQHKVLRFITEGDRRFDALSLEVFTYQYTSSVSYRNLCKQHGASPTPVKRWEEIPAVPALAFKHLEVACQPVEQAQRVFLSSGTTQGGRRSRHHMFDLRLYECAIERHFKKHLLPDRDEILTFVLMPPADEMPDSSLAYMLDFARQRFGTPGSGHFVSVSNGIDAARLVNRMNSRDEPVMLLGTSFSFVHLLDYCAGNHITLQLPEGSRVMDTGGFKGKSREVDRDQLLRLFWDVLGVPPAFCVNEYGMSELSSQFYDHTAGEKERTRIYRPPHWVRTQVIDPRTSGEAHPSEIGILRHWDLANLHSAMVIQTEDLGRAVGEGFVVLGRASGAEARGCSLAMDELIGGEWGNGEMGEWMTG